MKTYADWITLYTFSNSDYDTTRSTPFVDYIDTVHDVEFSRGVITWRREGQDIIDGLQRGYTFPVNDVHLDDIRPLAQAILRLDYGVMGLAKAVLAAEKIFRSIRNEIPSGNGWKYTHSKKYHELRESNRLREVASEAGELAQWEIEILERPLAVPFEQVV